METTDRVASTFWHSATRIALALALLVSAVFLFTEHRAHLLGALPFLFLLSCPLMHMFMHHGHKHGSQTHGQPRPDGNKQP